MYFNGVTKNITNIYATIRHSPNQPRAPRYSYKNHWTPFAPIVLPGNAVSAQWQGRTFFLALHSPEAQKPIEVATDGGDTTFGVWTSAGCDDGLYVFICLYAISLVSSWPYYDVDIGYSG
jgi:hypothetical protein